MKMLKDDSPCFIRIHVYQPGLTSIVSYPVDIDGLLPLVVLKHCLDLITDLITDLIAFVRDVFHCNNKSKTRDRGSAPSEGTVRPG